MFYSFFYLRKFYTNFYNSTVVCNVWNCILFTVNLFQSIFCRCIIVHFELKNVDAVSRFYYRIGSAFVVFYFGLNKLSHQRKKKIKNVLKILLFFQVLQFSAPQKVLFYPKNTLLVWITTNFFQTCGDDPKIRFTCSPQSIYILCFIHIKIIVCTQFFKTLYANGQFPYRINKQ